MIDIPGVPQQPGESPINPDTDFQTPGGDQGIADPTIGGGTGIEEADIQEFQQNMDAATLDAPAQEVQANSVMDLSRDMSTNPAEIQDLESSSKSIESNLDQVKSHLDFFEKNENLSLPPGQDQSIKGSIKDFSESFKSVSKDIDGPELDSPPSIGSPLKSFLSYFTGTQDKMNEMTATLNSKSGDMSTGELLKVQHKMNKMQQQVEFATTTVNKVVEFLKQMQNIQL
jgi:hypothetical protein